MTAEDLSIAFHERRADLGCSKLLTRAQRWFGACENAVRTFFTSTSALTSSGMQGETRDQRQDNEAPPFDTIIQNKAEKVIHLTLIKEV